MRPRITLAAVIALLGAAFSTVAGYAAAPEARSDDRTADAATCLKARSSQSAGAVAASAAFEPIRCPAGILAATFRYDAASGASRLLRPVTQGEVVPNYPDARLDRIQPGQRLQLVVTAGAVRIVRDVEALQAARPGQRLFVKSENGEVLSVRYESVQP